MSTVTHSTGSHASHAVHTVDAVVPRTRQRRRTGAWLAALAASVLGAGPLYAANNIAISQVYGGGGNSGATLTNDFIELFNRGSTPVSVNGWSVQYASSTGSSWSKTNLPNVTLSPGQYLLVQERAGAGGSVSLPTPDASGTIAMSASAGKVVLRSSTTVFPSGTVCPSGADVIDTVGYGPATNCFETAPTSPNLTDTTAALRASGGCSDTDSNAADFSNAAPTPRNSVAPFNVCGGPVNQPIVPTCPATLAITVGVGGSAGISANDADGVVSTASITSAPVVGIALSSVTAGSTLTAQLDVANSVPAGNYNVTLGFANNDAIPQTANCTVAVNVAPPVVATRIHDIQGAAHISPINGQSVSNVPGIVTAKSSNGFWLQDVSPDSDPATSEGIFVFTSSAPTVSVGDSLQVSGTVQEYRPGGASSGNLTITEIVNPTVTTVSSGNALPAPTLLGIGGREIPTTVIDDDATGNVESSGSFDAANDGIDFYESLEGMRVQVNNPVASGPRNRFGEISLLADNGANAGVRTPRGGILYSTYADGNPERIQVDDEILRDLAPAPRPSRAMPDLDVGALVTSPIVGPLDYTFANYKIQATTTPTFTPSTIAKEVTAAPRDQELAVATFNVENLSVKDPQAKFDQLAAIVVDNLRAPDLIGIEEVQDDSGFTDNGVVDASQTWSRLIAAIQGAGGPLYEYRSINPLDKQDGGAPGGNIRVGFLFRTDRGLSFVDRPGGDATTPTAVVDHPSGPRLSLSPGRIDPASPAYAETRKSLAGEFRFRGKKLFAVVVHFSSKGGDQPLFGRFQPPTRSSEVARHGQAEVVADFVDELRDADPNAYVVVLGDVNDFQFSETVEILGEGGLSTFVNELPASERYSYVFGGNSQVLDQILGTSPVLGRLVEYDIVHVNSEYAVQESDHDPSVARIEMIGRS